MAFKISWKKKLLFFYLISFIIIIPIALISPDIFMAFDTNILILIVFVMYLSAGNYAITKGNRD